MLIHWIWLATRPNMSDREKYAVLTHFGDPEDIFYAQNKDYAEMEEMTQTMAVSLADKDLHHAGAIVRQCMEGNIHICAFSDAAYPESLKNIADPPMVLYCKGQLPDFDGRPSIGVVGTRSATAYGLHVAKRIGGQIAKCGGIVVSGLAAGIDGAAMSGALTEGGKAVGVLGSGVDIVYPADNRSLFADTERYGCLISEFPPGTPPVRWNFPKRNRIISGLSNGVLIVEAPRKSGALITARQAGEQGRDVFVVPGNIDVASCEGSNALLREGATAVSSGWDIISEYVQLYPDTIVHLESSVGTPGFTGEVMPICPPEEKKLPKVAQKSRKITKTPDSDTKKQKNPIDNPEKPPYIDIRDTIDKLPENEKQVAMLLLDGEKLVDDVIAASEIQAGAVLSALTMLEIRGIVTRKPGKRVSLK